MDSASAPLGIFLLVIGLGLVLWEKTRKFDRTNSYGVEQFGSFPGKIKARVLDGLLSWLSLSFLFGGLLILSIRFLDTWGWIVILPLIPFLLFFVA